MNTVYIIRRQFGEFYRTWHPHPEYGYFETQAAANAWCEAQENPEIWDYTEVTLNRPLDPTPWVMGANTSQRVEQRSSQVPEGEYPGKGYEKWRFEPRKGFDLNTENYAVRGGLDPLPLRVHVPEGKVLRGRTRYGVGEEYFGKSSLFFDPREGFETDRSKYGV